VDSKCELATLASCVCASLKDVPIPLSASHDTAASPEWRLCSMRRQRASPIDHQADESAAIAQAGRNAIDGEMDRQLHRLVLVTGTMVLQQCHLQMV
jgi:hypothetical protein